jgi:rubrerythrin
VRLMSDIDWYPEGKDWRCEQCDYACDDDGPDRCPDHGTPLYRVSVVRLRVAKMAEQR